MTMLLNSSQEQISLGVTDIEEAALSNSHFSSFEKWSCFIKQSNVFPVQTPAHRWDGLKFKLVFWNILNNKNS